MSKEDLKSELSSLFCCQNWDYRNKYLKDPVKFDKFFKCNEERMEETVEESDTGRKFWFISFIISSYLQYLEGNYEKSLKCLDDFEKLFVGKEYIDKLESTTPAFMHILYAEKAHVYYEMDDLKSTKKFIELAKEEGMDFESHPFLFAQALLTGKSVPDGLDDTIINLKLCVDMDPTNSNYHYKLGNMMSRKRKLSMMQMPCEDEIRHLSLAFQMDPQIDYALGLVRSYRDKGMYSKDKKEKILFSNKASNICIDLLENNREDLKPFDIANLVFFLHSSRNIDVDKVNAILEEVADSPKASTKFNHYIGLYYLKTLQVDKALPFLERANEYLPFLTSIVAWLKMKIDSHEDIADYIESINNFSQLEHCQFCLSVSEFYLVIMDDIKTACNWFIRATDVTPYSLRYTGSLCRKFNYVYVPTLYKEVCNNRGLFERDEFYNLIELMKNEKPYQDKPVPWAKSIRQFLY